ncbi:hypothetical protein [Sphingomonas nostoxanthinifaciens]|uniref:hypothetical protein n=1 Tax=Sphingomonas nostoxanthinifaciens TaxID=2872652 RepID=UPI001CC1D390|nr:hypothetical protein [Sphingomonas nostoxanthinifaciens]UAK24343.1 hypothetical protein K8P63_18855 [Sphingomonas nostoxanthinifaciens]
MPALPADIGAAIRDVLIVTWSDPDIALRYPGARDGSVTVADGYFDDEADALEVIEARGALIGEERRRFTVVAMDLFWPAVSTDVPRALLVDPEQGANTAFIISRLEDDLEAETSSFELFG